MCECALPLSAASWSRSISTTSMPACAADIGDARAHEAGADDADLFDRASAARSSAGARPCSTPASTRTASGSSPPLPASAGSWRTSAISTRSARSIGNCRPSIDASAGWPRRRIIVVASRGGRCALAAGQTIMPAGERPCRPGSLKPFIVPRRDGLAAGLDPVLRRCRRFRPRGATACDEVHRFRRGGA